MGVPETYVIHYTHALGERECGRYMYLKVKEYYNWSKVS